MAMSLRASLIFAFSIVGLVFVGCCALFTVPILLTEREFLKERDDPVVHRVIQAANDYYAENGIWPMGFRQLPAEQVEGLHRDWEFFWLGYDDPPQLHRHGPVHMDLRFQFPNDPTIEPGIWSATEEGSPLRFQPSDVSVHYVPLDDELQRANTIKELERRVRLDPGCADHPTKLEKVCKTQD